MNRTIVSLVFSFLSVIPCFLEAHSWETPTRNVALQDQKAIDALLWLGELYKQPLGILASDKSISTTSVSVQLSDASFSDALAKVLVQLPKYESRTIDGIVLVQAIRRDPATDGLFAMVLSSFDSSREATLSELADLLWMDVEVQLDPSIRAFSMIGSEKDETQIQELHLRAVAVEDVLNELVRKRRSAAWVGFRPPETLTGVNRQRLWSIVTYEDPPAPVQSLCCLERRSLPMN